jgi:hypothetical protein
MRLSESAAFTFKQSSVALLVLRVGKSHPFDAVTPSPPKTPLVKARNERVHRLAEAELGKRG